MKKQNTLTVEDNIYMLGDYTNPAHATIISKKLSDPKTGSLFLVNLVEGLKHPNTSVRKEVATILGNIGHHASDVYDNYEALGEAKKELKQALSSPDHEMVVRAARALIRLGSDTKSSIQAFIRLLSEENPYARMEAAKWLAFEDIKPECAIPIVDQALTKCLSDRNDLVALTAARARITIGFDPTPSIVMFMAHISFQDMYARRYAVEAICEIDIVPNLKAEALQTALATSKSWIPDREAKWVIEFEKLTHQIASEGLAKLESLSKLARPTFTAATQARLGG